ncbi:PAS domain S-box-containing protein/diguanylate cyclase (GGDEF) domain-containing protein [Anaerobranca californiensis DSM 14826]|jgi:diguanylate cyclase (GGDEF)-like protein/PAS domain S-box-containing protein|uniref:Stage 0 sporulation protein A homolog n=1 Tax=Anaerobranca californiensis DSM 14826 TaxID=1120989 RepID=A0A1M6RI09_9FIRM|nr:diguanylate cyclase [Anaerobranca californiensis]SHK32151.1 PAS domain S-box-containing protein/diguanylate cyclase (GGDEF) domain-containing protein [Anaerobranca californiensis DSM 14826]
MYNRKILLIEDSKLNIKILTDQLMDYGYLVENCISGEKAIEKIKEGFLPDLILMDIELKGRKDGIETAEEILKIHDLPILFLTSNTSKEILERIKRVKNYGYILKGTDIFILLSSIESAIRLAETSSEAKLYQDIYEHTLGEIYIINPDTLKIISANKAVRKNLGYSLEELKNMKIIDINSDFDKIKEKIRLLIQGIEREVVFEGHNQKKDGSQYPVEVKVKINKHLDKKLLVVLVNDLTEKVRAEEEKRKKEKYVQLMLNALPSPAWLVSKERKILLENKIAKDIFKTEEGAFCWESIQKMEFLPQGHKEWYLEKGQPLPGTKCYFCKGDEVLKTGETANEEIKIQGKIWNIWWIPLEDEMYLHYAVDVTKYKEIEEKLMYLSLTDSLTKAYNRRYMTEKLTEELERVKRNNSTFSVIMLDIDHFKNINDTFGHDAGDLVLQKLTEMIKNRIRKIDVLARWGGEEFLILLPDTPLENAVVLAEELRLKLSEMEIPNVQKVTASFGVANYLPGDSIDTLVKKADDMMYKAKKKDVIKLNIGVNVVKFRINC